MIAAHDLAAQLGLLGQDGQAEILLADGRLARRRARAPLTDPAAALTRPAALLGLPVFAFVGQCCWPLGTR